MSSEIDVAESSEANAEPSARGDRGGAFKVRPESPATQTSSARSAEHNPDGWAAPALRRFAERDIFGVNAAVMFLLMVPLIVGYVARLRWPGYMFPPDSRYYVTMTLRDMGHDSATALSMQYKLAGNPAEAWFYSHQDGAWLMVQSRILYPFLSIPFVWLFGLESGMVVVPMLGLLMAVYAVARIVQRLYGPFAALAAGGLMAAAPFIMYLAEALTDPVVMGIMALILLNLPLGKQARSHNLVFLGLLSVLLCLTRQSMPAAAGMVFGGWLWTAVFNAGGGRRIRNAWAGPALVVCGITTVLQLSLSLLAGTRIGGGTTDPLPVVGWNILWQDALGIVKGDHVVLMMMLGALLFLIFKFKDVVSGVFLGAAAGTFVIMALGLTPSGYRYESVIYPAAAIAAGAFIHLLSPAGLRKTTEDAPVTGPTWWQRRTYRVPALGVACVLGVSGLVGWSATHGSASMTGYVPTAPAAAAALAGSGLERTPKEHPSAAQALNLVFTNADNMLAKKDNYLTGFFDWRHPLRYRPTTAQDPGWDLREADGTAIVRYGDFTEKQYGLFASAISVGGTADPNSVKIDTRVTSKFGEDVTFTVQAKGKAHHGHATILYPVRPLTPVTVTEIVFDS